MVMGGIGLMWPTLGITASLVIGKSRPDAVLPWWSLDADTQAAAAAAQIVDGRPRPEALAQATALAQASLRREPVSVVGARTLALVSALHGNQVQAEHMMLYTESLSRRDVAIQFWLIESSVRKNDIQGALLHYDRALRTSPGSAQILYPILVEASTNLGVRGPLARMLARRPPWWSDFADRLIAQGHSPAAIEEIVGALRLDPQNPAERTLLTAAVSRSIETGNDDLGFEIYRRAMRSAAGEGAPLRNGAFEGENLIPPIDWSLADDEDLQAIMQPRTSGAGGRALFLVARNGRGGEIARQLLRLSPGGYRLTALVGAVAGASLDRPQMTLSCAHPNQMLFDLRLPVSADAGNSLSQDFTVPPGPCRFQWLRISASAGLAQDAPNTWIDDIGILHTQ
jgi:tetratricopeptide (TPR) repeat protein